MKVIAYKSQYWEQSDLGWGLTVASGVSVICLWVALVQIGIYFCGNSKCTRKSKPTTQKVTSETLLAVNTPFYKANNMVGT